MIPRKGFDTVFLVGYDGSPDNGIPNLIVGKKNGPTIDILNVITGPEATTLYVCLTGGKEIGIAPACAGDSIQITPDGAEAVEIDVGEMVIPDDITYKGEG